MFFCKFGSEEDRDLIVANIKRLVLKIEDTKIWSNPDLPTDVRAPETFLFDLKKMLVEWGYTRESVWVDKPKKTISLGGKMILGVTMDQLEMQLTFGPAWENHLRGAEFTKLVKDAQDKLKSASKGEGKGKAGPAGS